MVTFLLKWASSAFLRSHLRSQARVPVRRPVSRAELCRCREARTAAGPGAPHRHGRWATRGWTQSAQILCDGGDKYLSKCWNPEWRQLKDLEPEGKDDLSFVL